MELSLIALVLGVGFVIALALQDRRQQSGWASSHPSNEGELVRAFEEALRDHGATDPRLAKPAWALGTYYADAGRFSEALGPLRHCVQAACEDEEGAGLARSALLEIGIAQARLGAHEDAVRAIDEADALDDGPCDGTCLVRAEVAIIAGRATADDARSREAT